LRAFSGVKRGMRGGEYWTHPPLFMGGDTIPPPVQSAICHCLPTLSCLTHATPHSIFSQSEHVEASSSPANYTIGMAEITASTGHALLPYILNFQWTHKIHALLRHRLITVTFMTQRLHRLRSHALLLRSLSLSRLRSPGTPAIALGLKSTNHSPQIPGVHVIFSQILSFSQTLFLMSLYHLLLSSSQTLKQTPLKSSLKGLITATILVLLRLHVIYGSRFKQPSSSVYLTQKLSKYLRCVGSYTRRVYTRLI
jgi:hypothetical protein